MGEMIVWGKGPLPRSFKMSHLSAIAATKPMEGVRV
jgi:hypothetical protein